MSRFRNSLNIGVAFGAMCWSGVVFAQAGGPGASVPQASAPTDDQATEGDDIVVTGFRRSLQAAADAKRKADYVSDGISAEDIGQFPDQNLAESLQRVTGVQITRNRGEGGQISIRGLAPSFVRVQYNGRTLASGGDRSFDFTTLSSEFVSSVDVQKSPTADLVEGGLSGTVNVRTPRPLDVGRTTGSLTVGGVYEDLSENGAPRAAGLLNYVNADKTFGLNVGVSYEQRRYANNFYRAYGAETGKENTRGPALDYNVDGDMLDVYSFDHAQSYDSVTGGRNRVTAIGSFQWKPIDDLELYGDGFYSRYRDHNVAHEISTRYTNIAPARAGDPYGVVSSKIDTGFLGALQPFGNEPSQGFLTTLDANGVDYRTDTRPQTQFNDIYSFAGGARWTSGALTIDARGSYTDSKAGGTDGQFAVISRAAVQISHPDGVGGIPTLTFNRGYDPSNVSTYNFLSRTYIRYVNQDRETELHLDAKYDLTNNFFRSVQLGAYYSNRHNTGGGVFAYLGADTLARIARLPYQANVENGSVAAAPFLSVLRYNSAIPGGPAQFLTPDLTKFDALAPEASVRAVAPLDLQPTSGFDITERTWAGFAQANFEQRGLRGNIGVRYIHTDQSSTGVVPDLNNITIVAGGVGTNVPQTGAPVTFQKSYNYFLPNLNVSYDITPQLVVRAAVARVLARANLGQLSTGTSVNANVLQINSSNPQLDPYISDQFDLSLEYYFPRGGLISGTFFYKNVQNFILDGQTIEIYTAFQLPARTPVSLTFRRNQPLNVAEVKLKGIELAVQFPLRFLPSPLDGFGVFANGTYIDAPSVPRFQGGLPYSLPGVSKYSYTVGAYYEKYGLGVHASYNWRDKYDNGAGADYFGDGDFSRAYGQFDLAASYQVTKMFGVKVDVSNLLNAKQEGENNFGLTRFYSDLGRRVTGSVTVKF